MIGLLVGYGSVGRRHLANLHALGVTDWAVVHTGRGTLPFEPPCDVRSYATLEEALAAESPRFAVVANPTSLHTATALACAAVGCDLLLEKPVASSTTDVAALEGSLVAGVEVLVGFQFRFDSGLQRARDIVNAETLGRPLHARVTWAEYLPDWHPWEDWRQGYAARRDLGGGVHHTICHPFDYLRMLFGDVVEVQARFISPGPLGLDVPEGVDATLRFRNDITAQVHLNYWSRPRIHAVEIVCTGGTLTWDYITGELRVWQTGSDSAALEQHAGIRGRDELFVAEARHFLDVVARRELPVCTLADGAATVRICDAIERAAETGSIAAVR